MGQLPIVFQADSLEALAGIDFPNLQLVRGRTFRIELGLRLPVAAAFNLAGAESVFRPAMPSGLDLIDVRAEGSNKVIIDTEIVDVAQAGQGSADMQIAPAVAAIGGFIAAHWLGISLAAIGLFILLGPLINTVTGRTDFATIGDISDIAKWGAVALIAVVALNAIKVVRP